MKTAFLNTENTKIYNSYSSGWTGKTTVKVNGKNWVITTMKRYNGTIGTHCHIVQDAGNGSYSYVMFEQKAANEEFWLNILPKGTKATEKTIREAHFKALAEFDAKNERGELPKESEEYKIEVGQVLFTDWINGGDENRRAIYEIENTDFGVKYKTVLLDGSKTDRDDHIRPYSKKFGIGVYYNEGDKISQDEINDLLIRAKQNMELERAKEEAQSIINEEQAKAKAKYLSQFKRADRRTTTNIIKRHILRNWASVSKVEVKTDIFSGGDSMDVTYYAPEEIKELNSFIKNFQNSHADITGDYWDYDTDKQEIILEGHILQTYKYVFDRFEQSDVIREQKTEAVKVETVQTAQSNDFEVIEYSEKSFAVFGEATRQFSELLKNIGAFNKFLKHNGEKRAGWIFSNKRREQVFQILGLQ